MVTTTEVPVTTKKKPKTVPEVIEEAKQLGAKEGAERLDFVYSHYTDLTLEAAYQLINPIAIQHEVEDAMSHRVGLWNILRNATSVLPLILTWFALSTASEAYQFDTFKKDIGKSFLQLWQEGFSGTIIKVLGFIPLRVIPFSTAAVLDVILLLIYLTLVVTASLKDRQAYTRATEFAKVLQDATNQVMKSVSTAIQDAKEPIIKNRAAIDNVADAVRMVVNDAMLANQKLIESVMQKDTERNDLIRTEFKAYINEVRYLFDANQEQSRMDFQNISTLAQNAIETSNKHTEDLYGQVITPMLGQIDQGIKMLFTELTNYQARLNALTNASKKLADVSDQLMNNATAYTTLGETIRDNIKELNSTQKGMLEQIKGVGDNVKASGSSMIATANSMQRATEGVQQIATTLTVGVQNSIKEMNTNARQTLSQMNSEVLATSTTMSDKMQDVANTVDSTSSTLASLSTDLKKAASSLDKAATRLSRAKFGTDQKQPIKRNWFLRKE